MYNSTEGGQSNDEPDRRSQGFRRFGEVGARHSVRVKSRIWHPSLFLFFSSVKASGSAVGCVRPSGGLCGGSTCSIDTTRLSDDIDGASEAWGQPPLQEYHDNDVTTLTPLVSYVTADEF